MLEWCPKKEEKKNLMKPQNWSLRNKHKSLEGNEEKMTQLL